MVRTISLLIGYDGTDFHGWQRQPGLRTVQGVLEDVIQHVVRHPVNVAGSGRTDAGVHAAGHVDSFTTTATLEPDHLRSAIDSRLPQDIALLALRDVHPDFQATRSAISKVYRYRIHHATTKPPGQTAQRYAYHYWHPLAVSRMRIASRAFLGRHDFTSMTPTHTVRESMVRSIFRCDVEQHLREIRIDLEGDGFLYNQVRTMVGTLLEVGQGRWEPGHISEILASRDRSQAGSTAPAHGLCLQWVRYPPHLLSPPQPLFDNGVKNEATDNQSHDASACDPPS